MRFPVPFVLCLAVAVGGCNKPPPPPPPVVAPTFPAPDGAIRDLYTRFAADPKGFAWLPALSRFSIDDNRRIDTACAAGQTLPACTIDRLTCLVHPPVRPGRLVSATLDGHQPGVSASVKLVLEFPDGTATPTVDAVFEDGAWKVDQVRCP